MKARTYRETILYLWKSHKNSFSFVPFGIYVFLNTIQLYQSKAKFLNISIFFLCSTVNVRVSIQVSFCEFSNHEIRVFLDFDFQDFHLFLIPEISPIYYSMFVLGTLVEDSASENPPGKNQQTANFVPRRSRFLIYP